MEKLARINPNYYEDGCLTLELCKSLYPSYVKANLERKAQIANLAVSNYSLIDVNLIPKRRRPFDIFAESLHPHDASPELNRGLFELAQRLANWCSESIRRRGYAAALPGTPKYFSPFPPRDSGAFQRSSSWHAALRSDWVP